MAISAFFSPGKDRSAWKISIVYISLIIFILGLIFVGINYFSTKKTLYSNLAERARKHQKEFELTLQLTYRNMMQMSQFISQTEELNNLFLKGKKAVEQEGGGSGGIKAQEARQELLRKIKPAWDHLTREFDVRQLHYQLGPGSLSFLRVHKPHKYGDRMDDIRYTIVDTNAEKKARFGFETGRVYSGLRGVSPVWTIDPQTKEKVYVGALEVGTSFEQILPLFKNFSQVDIAVLLSKQHIEKKMWKEFIKEYFDANPDIDFYIEASSSKTVKSRLSALTISDDFTTDTIELIKDKSNHISIYYFPLRDYQANRDKSLPPAGFVMMWEDVTGIVDAFNKAFIINIIYALIGFILVEMVLIWSFNREGTLVVARKDALVDGLTQVFNRRYFDNLFKNEQNREKRFGHPLSLIMCDIDFFKKFNDTYGHQAGDECLKKVAAVLRDSAKRGGDCVARYGGEEFVIVLSHTDLKGAIGIADKVRQAVCNLNIPHINSSPKPFVTISLGVACSDNLGEDENLLCVADQNLYLAKDKGRNRVEPKNETV